MQFAQHEISKARAGAPGSRMAGLALVGVLHIALIYAILMGLVPKFSGIVVPDITVIPVPHTVIPVALTHPATFDNATFAGPRSSDPTAPVFQIEDDRSNNHQNPTGTGESDSVARAITASHTSPPYPSLARRLGEEGKVLLRLTVGTDGKVSAAAVERSSGSDDLDEAAIAWVIAHWRYQPSLHAGAPTISTTEAVVEFDLRKG